MTGSNVSGSLREAERTELEYLRELVDGMNLGDVSG